MADFIVQAIFAGYFLLIAACFVLVFKSAFRGVSLDNAWTSGSYVFLRNALFALVCTWYYMLRFLEWSRLDYGRHHLQSTFAGWLNDTSLFTQAWRVVCTSEGNWWWSKIICYWTVIYTVLMFVEGPRRRIKSLWAYMLLGQVVAISVSTCLFLFAMMSHPPTDNRKHRAPVTLWLPVLLALVPIELTPYVVHTKWFLPNLLLLHILLLVPFLSSSLDGHKATASGSSYVSPGKLYAILSTFAIVSQVATTYTLFNTYHTFPRFATHIINKLLSHPAISSIGFDAIWVILTLFTWFLSTGTDLTKLFKMGAVAIGGMAVAGVAGMDWKLLVSVIPIGVMAALAGMGLLLHNIRERNTIRQAALLKELGVADIPVKAKRGEKKGQKATIAGFWHPYCNAGGGGERVLWTAIAFLQRTEPRTVSLVYTGDYPQSSKEAIIGKVKERFGLDLNPKLMHFGPLPSREIISDTYWTRFTLLGQSIGSIALAWEGLCGQDGLWGDVFIDTMGYAFALPLVRLVAGSDIAIGTYTHYPTVSTDMVDRVRAGIKGHTNAGASGSKLRTRLKLIYYQVFTRLYSVALLFSGHTMTNSSWTQAHIKSLLLAGRSSTLASLMTMDMSALEKRNTPVPKCEVVYPPCDTAELVKLGKLDKRKRLIVSLAQFRPEKEHYKQLHALAELFKAHPEYRNDTAARVDLVMMGSVRGEADEQRLGGLKKLAQELGVHDNVEFVVNAPYPEIIRRLGEGSVGLNTMMDEHFGISVVEFMAAGLIPLVHASAGPMMDIVVPHNGEVTGYHGTTAESFAAHLHEIFNMTGGKQLKMRKAARARAVDCFSQANFDEGFNRGWQVLSRATAS